MSRRPLGFVKRQRGRPAGEGAVGVKTQNPMDLVDGWAQRGSHMGWILNGLNGPPGFGPGLFEVLDSNFAAGFIHIQCTFMFILSFSICFQQDKI